MVIMASDLEKKIIHQVEYYFGDINLPRDKFLQEKIKEDEGWVTLEVLTTFKRLANLTSDIDVIATALEKAENKLLELHEDRKKVRRSADQPLPELNEGRRKELMSRSAYVKGFPLDEDLNNIINFLEPHGPIESCIRRTTKDHKFKGSCFVVFKDIETCKKFVELEELKYKDVDLIRKWQNVYTEEKKKEVEEHKKNKQAKKQAQAAANAKPPKPVEMPKGAVLFFDGIEKEQTLTREEIKERIREVGNLEVAYIDFNKGDLEGYARFGAENCAVKFAEKLKDGQFTIGEIKLKVKVLENEEEEQYLKKTIEAIATMRQKLGQNKFGGRNSRGNNRKRKGNFSSYGSKAKKQN